jgi:molybdopterin synthase sulfur carrier subunit
MAGVTVRYWAAAKEAAGTEEEKISADTLADAIDVIRGSRVGDVRFDNVLKRSSFLVDSVPVGKRAHETVLLPDGGVIEVLPAFAGG